MTELKLQSLRRDFPAFQFGPLTTTFAPGTIYGLLGPNGAGKTTLLNLIALQLQPTSGSMTCDSGPVAWGDLRWKQAIAYVRETPVFYDELSVAQTLRFAGALHDRWDSGLARRLADRFGLDDARNLRTLSKGSKVKLGLVLALAQGAGLVLLDEPTAGVDPTSREEFHQAIKDLREQRPDLCIVLSSHIFDDLSPLPVSADIRLTWVSKGERWVMLPRHSGLVATLRSVSGCVEDRVDSMVAAAYRGTAHAQSANGV